MSVRFPDDLVTVLGRAMSLQLDRQHLITSNIANADTPGFTPIDMNFAAALQSEIRGGALNQTDQHHLPALVQDGGEALLYEDPSATPGLDGNAVVLDREMAKMAENTMLYNATSRALQKKLGMLRYAISEGGAQ